jgi:predicted Fe-Mo cluster-binding NifX family protein
MNVAIPILEDRVSPVFDVAQSVVLIELDARQELRRRTFELLSRDLGQRVAEVLRHGVNVLICGAISRPLEAMLQAAGIRVIPQICGDVEDVVQAFIASHLNDRAFLMPGCRERRRHGWRGAPRGVPCSRRRKSNRAYEQEH